MSDIKKHSLTVRQALAGMAALYNRDINSIGVNLLLDDLSHIPDEEVLNALSRCRRELRFFPTVADILDRVKTDRPGPQEAFGMLPTGEGETVVWTSEMREADAARAGLDPIAGRMAFLEVYSKLVNNARAENRPVKWEVSIGHDPQQRKRAIMAAVEQGKITRDYAQRILPDVDPAPVKAIEGTVEHNNVRSIQDILKNVLKEVPKPPVSQTPPRPVDPEELQARKQMFLEQARRMAERERKESGK